MAHTIGVKSLVVFLSVVLLWALLLSWSTQYGDKDYSSGMFFCLAVSNMFVPCTASHSHCYSIIGVSRAALLTMICRVYTESVCRNPLLVSVADS